jgi:hypothetical protein
VKAHVSNAIVDFDSLACVTITFAGCAKSFLKGLLSVRKFVSEASNHFYQYESLCTMSTCYLDCGFTSNSVETIEDRVKT